MVGWLVLAFSSLLVAPSQGRFTAGPNNSSSSIFSIVSECCANNVCCLAAVNDMPKMVQDHQAKGYRIQLSDGYGVFVRDQGRNFDQPHQPAVVMIHGVPASSLLYRDFFLPLVQHEYRAIAVDFPGLGLSDKPLHRDYSWLALARSLRETLEHDRLGLLVTNHQEHGNNNTGNTAPPSSAPIHLVIHDIGGPIAALMVANMQKQHVANNRPSLHIASMTILDTFWDLESFQKPFPMSIFALPILGTIAIGTMTPWIFRQFMYLDGVQNQEAFKHDDAVAWTWLLLQYDHGANALLKIMKSFPRGDEKPRITMKIRKFLGKKAMETAAATTIPMQLVWASHESAIPFTQKRYIEENFDMKQVHVVPGYHFLQLDSPNFIVDRIHTFIQSTDTQKQLGNATATP